MEKERLTEFGTTFHYKKVFLGKMSDGDYVTIEEFIDGVFVKYINNNGDICAEDDVLCDKAQCFSHFTYEKSQGKLMVLDVQGAGLTLYDPEIASAELTDGDGSLRFCNGNLAEGLRISLQSTSVIFIVGSCSLSCYHWHPSKKVHVNYAYCTSSF